MKKAKGKFYIGVNALIKKGKQVLVLKRSLDKKYWPGLWNLPGGSLEFGEKPDETARREVKEEANLSVRLTGKIIGHHTYFSQKENKQAVVITFECIKPKGKIKIDVAHTKYQWINKKNWKKFKYTPSAKQALNEYYGRKN